MTKRIMIIPDSPNWAISSLSQAIIKHNPHFEFLCYYLHPRDVEQKIGEFKKAVKQFEPDIIHFQYYRSCSQALELWPDLKNYNIILTHHNQRTKAVHSKKWKDLGVEHLVAHTHKCADMLRSQGDGNVSVIQHGIDLDYFTFSDKEPKKPRIGYVGRIVPWKGLLEICKVAREVGHKVLIMGRLDKADYWKKVVAYEDVIDYTYFDCEDEERADAYRNMTIYVGNSKDGYEEGTLPYLEAMACGVPVVTTLNGEARDLAVDTENALVVPFEEEKDSYEKLKGSIKKLMEDKGLRGKLRNKAWRTVLKMREEKMAREYSSLYYKVGNYKDLVSVIIPATYSRGKEVKKILDGLNRQTYSNIEAIIVWDEIIRTAKRELKEYNFAVKELWTGRSRGYNLAVARNLGIIEAEGDYIMFCDSRLKPHEEAVEMFIKAKDILAEAEVWFFGDKSSGKKSFVENFSFVSRSEVIRMGMMNERITRYGGMSQDIRVRWHGLGNLFHFIPEARAEQLVGSGAKHDKRKDISDMKLLLFKLYDR